MSAVTQAGGAAHVCSDSTGAWTPLCGFSSEIKKQRINTLLLFTGSPGNRDKPSVPPG